MDQTTPPAASPVAATPIPTPTPVVPALTAAQHLKLFLDGLLNDVETVAKDIWDDNKAILIVLIPLIAVIFGRNLLMSLIVKQAKQTITKATKEDGQLSQQENQANTQANALEQQAATLQQQANSLQSTDAPVTDDWNKKQ